jgi:hypothetical protein
VCRPHAGHLTTIEAMIAELLKKAPGGLARPPGGGMVAERELWNIGTVTTGLTPP